MLVCLGSGAAVNLRKDMRLFVAFWLTNLRLKEPFMSDPAPTSPEHCSTPGAEPVSESVRSAIESGKDVKARVQEIVVNLFRSSEATAASARAAVSGIVQTSAEIVKRSAPENPDSVLRNVIDGVTAGLASVAQSTQYAIQEATSRGQRFAGQDLDRAKKDLNGISDILVDTVKYFTNRVTEETGATFRDLKTHAERAVAAVSPSIKASLETVAKHPVQTAGEAAGTAVRGTQLTAGALLGAMSGLLAGAADYLDPDRRKKEAAAAESSADQKDSAS